jgi:hypothetical protein
MFLFTSFVVGFEGCCISYAGVYAPRWCMYLDSQIIHVVNSICGLDSQKTEGVNGFFVNRSRPHSLSSLLASRFYIQ